MELPHSPSDLIRDGALYFLQQATIDDICVALVLVIVLVVACWKQVTAQSTDPLLDFFYSVPQASGAQVEKRERRAQTRNVTKAFAEWVGIPGSKTK